MSSLKTYLEDDNEIYGEVNLMINTKNQERLNKLYKALLDDSKEARLINIWLEKGFSELEKEYKVDLQSMTEDELRKKLKEN